MAHVGAYRSHGCLPLDCWYLIGKRCKVTVQYKIAATCSKLKKLYFQRYNLEKWINLIKSQNWPATFFEAGKYGRRDVIDIITLKLANQYTNFWYSWYQWLFPDYTVQYPSGLWECWYKGLVGAALGGHRDLVDFFIEKGANDWIDQGLQYAALGGHRSLVDFFISKGANIGVGLYGAARGAHRDLVDFFISEGANDWDTGLYGAARCTDSTVRRDLVDFFISKGADAWNLGMYGAARNGYRDLVEFFIEKGANDFNWGLKNAAKGGHRDLVELFIENAVSDGDVIHWDWGLEGAQKYGHQDLIDFFKQKIESQKNELRNEV